MRAGTKPPQLHPFPALNLLGVAVPPLHRHLRVGVGVHQHVEGAVAGQLREEGHRRGDLAEDGGDLGLDFLLGLFGFGFGSCRGCAVFVGCWGRGGAAGGLGDLDLVVLGIYSSGKGGRGGGGGGGRGREEGRRGRTSNCHRSTCSPVSLSVMTITRREILPPTIHLSSWPMMRLMYAFTWSSAETVRCQLGSFFILCLRWS